MATMAGCTTEEQWNAGDSFEDIIDCLRKKSATELIDIQGELEKSGQKFTGPTIDGAGGLLPEALDEMLRRRRPYRQITGTTSREFRYSKIIASEQGKVVNESLLMLTCLFVAQSRRFKQSLAVAHLCVDEYLKRRELCSRYSCSNSRFKYIRFVSDQLTYQALYYTYGRTILCENFT